VGAKQKQIRDRGPLVDPVVRTVGNGLWFENGVAHKHAQYNSGGWLGIFTKVNRKRWEVVEKGYWWPKNADHEFKYWAFNEGSSVTGKPCPLCTP
jgi:hypothetical protein